MSSFGIGYKALKAFVEKGDPLFWFKAKLIADMFKPGEREAWEFIQQHVNKYHALPNPQTLYGAFPDIQNFPTPEPANYYLEHLENRLYYERINAANVESQKLLKENQGNHAGALASLSGALDFITTHKYRMKVVDLAKEGSKIALTAYHNVMVAESVGSFGWKHMDDSSGGLMPGDVVTLIGRPGCLSGDSKIWVSRKADSSGRYYSLRDLHHRFNGGKIPTGKGKSYKRWNPNIDTRVNSLNDRGYTQLNEVVDVMYSGEKVTYTVTTASGKSIRATMDHRFKTPTGFSKLSELAVGNLVVCRSQTPPCEPSPKRKPTKEICTKLPYSPYRTRTVSGILYNRVRVPRLVFDANLNKMSVEQFVWGLKNNPNHNFVFSDPDCEIHHRDKNPDNNCPSNLLCLTPQEHNAVHAMESDNGRRYGGREVQPEAIVSIEYYGVEDTYDISMNAPHHNFVADDFVVHNSGKSWSLFHMAEHNWEMGHRPLVVSMEMAPVPVVQRFVSMKAGVPIGQMKKAAFSTHTYQKFTQGILEMAQMEGLYVVDGNLAASVEDVYTLAHQLGCNQVYIDGAYLLRHPNPRLDKFTRVSENVELMKRFTSEAGMPTIATYQFARSAVKNKKKDEKPGLEDIGLSDSIPQVSSVVLGLFQEDTVEAMNSRLISVMKGRDGETGEFRTKWDFNTMDFGQLPDEEDPEKTAQELENL